MIPCFYIVGFEGAITAFQHLEHHNGDLRLVATFTVDCIGVSNHPLPLLFWVLHSFLSNEPKENGNLVPFKHVFEKNLK